MAPQRKFRSMTALTNLGVQFLVAFAMINACSMQALYAKANSATDGTFEAGGATGIDRRVFESYIVNPKTLPAYQAFVEPLLQNIRSPKAS